jgi:hypothetical protein
VWSQVDFEAGTVQITSTLIRVKGEGLLRKRTKSRAGERTLPLPVSAVALLRRRFRSGARLDQPLFPDVLGGFRDPANVRRELRERVRGHARLGHVAHVTQDRGDDPRRGRAVGSPGRGSAGSQPSTMTRDVYMGRRAVDSQAALALEGALRDMAAGDEEGGKRVGHTQAEQP